MKNQKIIIIALFVFFLGACTSYKVEPLSFKAPGSYKNVQEVADAKVAAKAYDDPKQAEKVFGFNIIKSGLLPVQVVFDNLGNHELTINDKQVFLEDIEGNLWPILSKKIAYERATKYAQAKGMLKKGAYNSMLGAAAGSIIGAAIGVVTGENIGSAVGKGAAAGGALGATLGGASSYATDDARTEIINDLKQKSLENKGIQPKSLSHGMLFFPSEAKKAKQLRLDIVDEQTNKSYNIRLSF